MDSADFDYNSLLSLCLDPDGQKESKNGDDIIEVHRYDKCECGGKMFKTENMLQCSICPNMTSYINDDVTGFGPATAQYNSGSESYCRISRKGDSRANTHQRYLFPTATPEERKRKMVEHALAKLNVFNSSDSHNIRFPTHFLVEAAVMLIEIQIANYKSLKDTVYVGTLMRCLAIVCKKNKLYQKDQIFCKFAGISQTNLTQRNNLIRLMGEQGVIEYTKYFNPKESNFIQYFTKFEIPMEYIEFAHEIINIATPRNVRGNNNNTIDSKCAAIISILQRKLNMKFTDADICNKCGIVCATYEKYCRYLVYNRDALRPIFEKHGVPRLRSTDYQKKEPKSKPVEVVKEKRPRGRPPGVKNRKTVAAAIATAPVDGPPPLM
jgi:hypothetical protein